jgi:hypothetical protein
MGGALAVKYSEIILAPRFGAVTKADPLEVDPTVK